MSDCIFCKIAQKEIPADIKYEDAHVVVFPDLHPDKPVHFLIIPKNHVEEFAAVQDTQLFSHIGEAIQEMIRQSGLSDKGYRIVSNGGGAQEVNHLHFHLMGPIIPK